MTIKPVRVRAYRCRCQRCGRRVVVLEPPERCPSCKARNWLKPARPYRRKRKPHRKPRG